MVNAIGLLGAHGTCDIADTNPHTGLNLEAFQCIEDTVFSTLTINNNTVHGTISGKTYPAGTYRFGNITAITLTSGYVVGYNGPPEKTKLGVTE